MTDHAAPAMSASVHTTDAARNRLRARYREEAIFKYLGRGAIAVSVAFLVLLMSTIVWTGWPAFQYHFVSLPFEMTEIDGQNEESIKRADYDAVVRNGIRAEFPQVAGRSDRRLLSSLLSSGAPVLLREQALANPDKLANPQSFSLPISDFADLYLKGQVTGSINADHAEPASISVDGDNVTLSLGEAGFDDILQTIAERLLGEAVSVRGQRAGAMRSRDKAEADVAILQDRIPDADVATAERLTKERDHLIEQLAVVRQRIADLGVEAGDLETRAALAASQGEELSDQDPSLLIYVDNAVIKANAITPDSITGELLLPFAGAVPTVVDTWRTRLLETPETNRKFTDQEIVWTDELVEDDRIEKAFNWIFMTRGASREPEMAGVWGAVVGSFLTLIVTLALAFPLGVSAAIYLEEFAPKNRWTTLIEVNINNLAAVPSIVFGLLGLAVFLNFFGFDRSAPYVGGMVLALMTLPTIIIASRAALRAVPPSIREAAYGIGASPLQTVFHHVLPLAMPGIMTGTIIGMAQALGETAPLLMIGMVAFVVDVPGGFTDPSTVLPVQIFMWADFPEPAFQQRTSAAILVLLGFLILMNILAVVLRKRFERRW